MPEAIEEGTSQARRPRGLLPRLGLLAALVFAPLAGGVTIATFSHLQTIDHAADAVLSRLAVAGSFSVQSEIEGIVSGLRALAAASQFDAGRDDAEDLDRLVRRTATALGTPLTVIDRSLGAVADTALPFGSPLPPAPGAPVALQALETRRPVIGDLQPAADGIPAHIPVMVPVLRGTLPVAVIGARIERTRLEQRLFMAGGPSTLLLFDAQGRLLAGRGADRPDPPTLDPRLLAAMPDNVPQDMPLRLPDPQRGVARRVNADTGWTTIATISRAGLAAARDSAMLPAYLSAALALFFGLAGSVLLTGRLRRPIIALADFAHAVAKAGDAPLPDPPMALATAEFEALRIQLLHATTALSAREKRHRALAETGALVTWRADAGGALTEAAGWAALTGQEGRGLAQRGACR